MCAWYVRIPPSIACTPPHVHGSQRRTHGSFFLPCDFGVKVKWQAWWQGLYSLSHLTGPSFHSLILRQVLLSYRRLALNSVGSPPLPN